MPVNSMRQDRRLAPDGEDWSTQIRSQEEPAAGRSMSLAAALLLLLAVAVLCSAGFFVVRVLFSDSPPVSLPAVVMRTGLPSTSGPGPQATGLANTPGAIQIAVNPSQGYVNTLVTVTGQGWWPGEPVFVFLRSRAEGDGPGYAYAAAVADEQGRFRTAFTFPNEMRWVGEEWADVIARGSRSGREAIARFALVVPTPTPTLPLPTARPTSPSTDTPWPTETLPPEPTPTPDMIINDWRGEYFANPALAGDPVYVRNDVTIDLGWGNGSPDPRIPSDGFSVRWTRQMDFSQGFYRFVILADDGVRFWINGQLVVDEWHDSALTPYSLDLYLPRGQYSLWLEYYENLGGAMIRLSWAPIEPPTATPSATTRPSETPTPTQTYTATPSPTASPTDTPTATSTPTDTPTPTTSPTETPTPTPTPTDTPSVPPEPIGKSGSSLAPALRTPAV